jgi:hypothetical protein
MPEETDWPHMIVYLDAECLHRRSWSSSRHRPEALAEPVHGAGLCRGGRVGSSGALKSSLSIVYPAMKGGISVLALPSEYVMHMIEALPSKSIRWCAEFGLTMRAARQVSP